jgi:hypothetical protein
MLLVACHSKQLAIEDFGVGEQGECQYLFNKYDPRIIRYGSNISHGATVPDLPLVYIAQDGVVYANGFDKAKVGVYTGGKPVTGKVCIYEEYNVGHLSYEYVAVLRLEANYKDGVLNGISRTYDIFGDLASQTPYINGVKHGMASKYKVNLGGLLVNVTTPYNKGEIDGVSMTYYANDGELHSETPYTLGVINGVQKEYARSRLVEETPYIDGVKHGVYKQYSAGDGQLMLEIGYLYDTQDGHYRSYSTNDGLLIYDIFVVDGAAISGKCGDSTESNMQSMLFNTEMLDKWNNETSDWHKQYLAKVICEGEFGQPNPFL